MDDRPPTIEYATPKPIPSYIKCYGYAMLSWKVAAIGGVLIVLAAAVTHKSQFAEIGFFWLPIGGLLTLFSFISGAIYYAGAASAGFPAPHTRLRALAAVLLPLSNMPLAVFCAIAGIGALGIHMD